MSKEKKGPKSLSSEPFKRKKRDLVIVLREKREKDPRGRVSSCAREGEEKRRAKPNCPLLRRRRLPWLSGATGKKRERERDRKGRRADGRRGRKKRKDPSVNSFDERRGEKKERKGCRPNHAACSAGEKKKRNYIEGQLA